MKGKYLAVPPGYRMWQKKKTKLKAAYKIQQVMPEFQDPRNVIILCEVGT